MGEAGRRRLATEFSEAAFGAAPDRGDRDSVRRHTRDEDPARHPGDRPAIRRTEHGGDPDVQRARGGGRRGPPGRDGCRWSRSGCPTRLGEWIDDRRHSDDPLPPPVQRSAEVLGAARGVVAEVGVAVRRRACACAAVARLPGGRGRVPGQSRALRGSPAGHARSLVAGAEALAEACAARAERPEGARRGGGACTTRPSASSGSSKAPSRRSVASSFRWVSTTSILDRGAGSGPGPATVALTCWPCRAFIP